MQNNFESDFAFKLYKKKLEEMNKLSRSIKKFKKLYKIKNEDLDNISDKRFKDIVDAYKRTHQHPPQIDKKSTGQTNKTKNTFLKKSNSMTYEKTDLQMITDGRFFNSSKFDPRMESGIKSNNSKYKFQSNPSKFDKNK